MELICEPVFDYGRVPARMVCPGRRPHRRRQRRRRHDPAAHGSGRRHRGRPRPRQARAGAGRAALAARCPGQRSSSHLATSTTRTRGSLRPPVLAGLDRPRARPGPPLARADPALGARDQGTHLHADRRDGRRADDVAPGDTGRRAQLGLPLHVAARLDLHAAGAALPEPRLGGRGVHAVRRRPRSRTTTALCRSCTGSTAAATSPSRPATISPATRARTP